MPFKEGKIVDSFPVKGKDGEKIQLLFRYPKKSDAKLALKMVNSIRKEAKCLGQRRMETLKTERQWLKKSLENMRKGTALVIFVEVNKRLVGNTSIQPVHFDVSKHVGNFGIMLMEEFTGIGVGTRLAKKVLELAKKETSYKIIESGYFSKNKRSAVLHKKLGFKQWGKFPNDVVLRNGKYDDSICLYKQIKKL